MATINSSSSAPTIGKYRWTAESKQDDIRLQQERIECNEVLSHYCRFFETALHGLWNGGDVFHPSQSGVERPETGGPGIASVLSMGAEHGLGYVVESITVEMAAEALKVVPGGAGKMVEKLLTTHHQRKNNQLNVKFSESVTPGKRLVTGNTLARAVTEARSDKILESISKTGDTSSFMKWMKVICADTIGRYIEGTLCEDESPEVMRIRTLAWHDAFEFLLAQCNPEKSGMHDQVPASVTEMEDILPYQLEWLDRHLAAGSASRTQARPARTAEDYRQFVKPGVLMESESMHLKNEPVMRSLFTDKARVRKTLQIQKKQIHRLELNRQADLAMYRYLQANRLPPDTGNAGAGGTAVTSAVNAFLRGRATVSPSGFADFMQREDAPPTLTDVARYLDECQGIKTRQLHIGFFTPAAGIAKLKQALQPIVSRDVEAHPNNAGRYRQLEAALTASLQAAIDGHIDYDEARSKCRREVKEQYGAGGEHGNALGERLMNAVDKVFHDIREGLDSHEDALYALNAYIPRRSQPACREFIVCLRHDGGRVSEPFCFRSDDETGQWLVLGGPGSSGQGEPKAITPRDYFNDMVFADGKSPQVLGIDVLLPEEPFNPLIRLQERLI